MNAGPEDVRLLLLLVLDEDVVADDVEGVLAHHGTEDACISAGPIASLDVRILDVVVADDGLDMVSALPWASRGWW